MQLPRRHAKASAPKPRWTPLPGLLYAQVLKKMRRRRIVEVKRHVSLGTQAAVEQGLKVYDGVIHTSFVERLHLSLCQRVAPIRRQSATSCKGEAGLDGHLTWFEVYDHVVLPHASLPQALAAPMATNGSGSAKRWQQD